MNLKYKIALIAVPALLMFAGVGIAAHDGVLTAKDVSEVEGENAGEAMTIRGTVVHVDDQNCSRYSMQTGGEGTLNCFVLQSENEEGEKKFAFISQVEEAPAIGESVVASGKLRFYYDLGTGAVSWDMFGTQGTMQEKDAGRFWNAEQNPYGDFQPSAIMWLDATDYHETWFF